MPKKLKSLITIEELGPTQWVRPHPGEILFEEYMQPLALSANALALALRVPANRVLDIAKQKRGVTADTAMRLARYFNTSAQFWLNMQQSHDLSKARMEVGAKIERDVNPRDVKEMRAAR
jgi:antitoxin HigA-1